MTRNENAEATDPGTGGGEGRSRRPLDTRATAGRGNPNDTESEPEDTPASGRRRFLKAASVPPIATALAGCSILGGTGDGPPDPSGFGDAIRFEGEYALEIVETDSGQKPTIVGRFADGDHYVRSEQADAVIETYLVDGDSYVVTDGECRTYPDVATNPNGNGPETADAATEMELRRVETTTLDGQDVVVYELPAGATEGIDDTLTYYVDSDTRLMRRLETSDVVVNYHSWGDVDPIEPPDMDCRESG